MSVAPSAFLLSLPSQVSSSGSGANVATKKPTRTRRLPNSPATVLLRPTLEVVPQRNQARSRYSDNHDWVLQKSTATLWAQEGPYPQSTVMQNFRRDRASSLATVLPLRPTRLGWEEAARSARPGPMVLRSTRQHTVRQHSPTRMPMQLSWQTQASCDRWMRRMRRRHSRINRTGRRTRPQSCLRSKHR